MRTSSPIQVTIRRFAVWRWVVAAFTALATASIAVWTVLGPEPFAWRLGLGVACLLAIVYATGWLVLIPARPVDLRWDGACWLVGPAGAPAQHAEPVSLDVAIDAGAWMLLRLQVGPSCARRRTQWLPVERAALGADWHLLRSAVYTARPLRPSADPAGVLPP